MDKTPTHEHDAVEAEAIPAVAPTDDAVAAGEVFESADLAPGPAREETPEPLGEAGDRPTDAEADQALTPAPDSLREISEHLDALQSRLDRLELAVEGISKQVSFLPAQLRLIGGKLDGLATSISESRYRAVLLSLLGVCDLVDQLLRAEPTAAEEADAAEHRRNYEVLREQLRQILDMNGLFEIPTAGSFDRESHRAVAVVACDDPSESGRVVAVIRPGFRTETSVLRYAEVAVAKHVAPAPPVAIEKPMTGEQTNSEP